MRLPFAIAARCPAESSGKPYAQPGEVRCAVEASMTTVFLFSTSPTASRAASSGKHKKTASAPLMASLRAATSLRSASGNAMREMSSRFPSISRMRRPVVPALPSINTLIMFYLSFFASSIALTLRGRPNKLMKPSASFCEYAPPSSEKVAMSSL